VLSSLIPFLIPAINRSFDVEITLPGSKSIALRQLAIAALAQGTTRLIGIPDCDDAQAMIDCLIQLGVNIQTDGQHTVVKGPMDLGDSTVHLNARMSGASTRLLIGMAALRKGVTHIDGHPSLRVRSNKPLFDVLQAQGCAVEFASGGLPATITGPIEISPSLTIDGSLSSQYITALLLIAPMTCPDSGQMINISGDLVSKPYLDITLNEMNKCGVNAHWQDEKTIFVEQNQYQSGQRTIEGDATAATYFSALATLHCGSVTLTNIDQTTHQGDYEFCTVMEALGATVERSGHTRIVGPAKLSPLQEVNMQAMPDAALTLIAMSPLLPGSNTITGLQSLHHKECDRLECPATELRAMGVDVKTTLDSVTIEEIDPSKIAPHTLTTYHDHRMAMAFSMLGSCSHALRVDDKAVVNKTYPNYWQDYNKLIAKL
jgi:3-phosphoshikimate 1-carboxyvinyltransferase